MVDDFKKKNNMADILKFTIAVLITYGESKMEILKKNLRCER